jgi:hypothetical protein
MVRLDPVGFFAILGVAAFGRSTTRPGPAAPAAGVPVRLGAAVATLALGAPLG